MSLRLALIAAVSVLALSVAPSAQAAKTCTEPSDDINGWERATADEAAMDADKLQAAMDAGTTDTSWSIRVYRHGCLVGEDRLAERNRTAFYESWSMAKSVTSLIFGRAMTLGLVSADDPVGSLVPEADEGHGKVALENLLTMTSGLHWNGLRDYNVFTMPDRIRDALTLGIDHEPGTFFEYAQSPVSLLAEAVGRSTGGDIMDFAQRELMGPLGIEQGSWRWTRDSAGHVGGFYGIQMRPDDYGRLGDLLRRGGIWRGRRLLSREYLRRAIEPSRTNGCYGWLIWVNSAQPCIGPTISNRPVKNSRDWPDLPADMYNFSGLFGQRVTVFPTQDIVVVRTGQDPSMVPTGQPSWEHELYVGVLGAMTDQTWDAPGEAPRVNEEREDVDYGFQTAISDPDQYSKGLVQDPLPPAGPARARAALVSLAKKRAGKRGIVRVRVACPPVAAVACAGTATLTGAKAQSYDVAAGSARTVRFKLSKKSMRKLRKRGSLALTAAAVNSADGGETASQAGFSVRRPG